MASSCSVSLHLWICIVLVPIAGSPWDRDARHRANWYAFQCRQKPKLSWEHSSLCSKGQRRSCSQGAIKSMFVNIDLQCDHQNFVHKLREHILPCIQALLQNEAISGQSDFSETHASSEPRVSLSTIANDNPTNIPEDCECIFFQSDHMYKHQVMNINYTTYDVRRARDILNTGNSHRDIMVLSCRQNGENTAGYWFMFEHVIGLYHTNVIYTGAGSSDYSARRINFIWVCWFQQASTQNKWEDHSLDVVSFPPLADNDSFGFVDPNDVVCCCHLIPAFARGKVHTDSIGLSKYAGDADDWWCYYINRCDFVWMCWHFQ